MAKAVNKQDKSGKGKAKANGKPARGAAPAKRAAKGDAKPARKAQQKPRQQAKAAKPGERKGISKFLHDVRIEMGKVTWPTRQDLMQSTLVVLVAVAIAAVFTFALDEVFSQAVDFIVNIIT